MSYAVITAVRDDAANLARLASCLFEQTVKPAAWIIVDNGSSDATAMTAARFALEAPWVTVVSLPGEAVPTRGGPISRALEAGFERLDDSAELVVKVDADVSVLPDFFSSLIAEFGIDPRLGIASGARCDLRNGRWVPVYLTGINVHAQCRAYRRTCLMQVRPLENARGWDGVDVVQAHLGGWRTRVFDDLPFRHHRVVGGRDGSARRAWINEGAAAHFMGYRPSYVVARALYKTRRDRAAIWLIVGYVVTAARRAPQCPRRVREFVRREQAFRQLRSRGREATGRPASGRRGDLKRMSPDKIVELMKAGELDHLLDPRPAAGAGRSLRESIRANPEIVAEAIRSGTLAQLCADVAFDERIRRGSDPARWRA